MLVSGRVNEPEEAWNQAARETLFSPSTQKKGCPKDAFLGLCEAGLIKGIPAGSYTGSKDNKKYAIHGARTLEKNPRLASNKSALWREITQGEDKTHNQQMDVVVELWKKDLLEV